MIDTDTFKVRASEMGRALRYFASETNIIELKYSDKSRSIALAKSPVCSKAGKSFCWTAWCDNMKSETVTANLPL